MVFPAATQLAKNAHRLFDDAKLLARRGRYASAVALSILALEEVGKYHIYLWKDLDPKWTPKRSDPPRHSDKQAAVAAPFVGIVMQTAMIVITKKFAGRDWITARGPTEWDKAQDFLVEGYSVSQHHPDKVVRENAARILNHVSDFVEQQIDANSLSALMRKADEGFIDREKQAALYLDISSTGDIVSDPEGLNNKQAARFWLDLAEVALSILDSKPTAAAIALNFATRYEIKPNQRPPKGDPATAADWGTLFEKMHKEPAHPRPKRTRRKQ